MESWTMIMSAGLLLAIPLFTLRYLTRLPDAPACPSCRTVTREMERGWPGSHLLGQVAGMSHRTCTRCGWRGYMRWRWATRPVGENGTE